jgi:CheY-like chemotaxis protein
MKKILIIEDEWHIREAVANILEIYGYKVSVAENGLEAIKVLEIFTPDLIVCDIIMPKLNGIEFLRLIKKDKAFKKIPVIFLTAKSSDQYFNESINNGASGFLRKPFKIDNLILEIKKGLMKKNVLYN